MYLKCLDIYMYNFLEQYSKIQAQAKVYRITPRPPWTSGCRCCSPWRPAGTWTRPFQGTARRSATSPAPPPAGVYIVARYTAKHLQFVLAVLRIRFILIRIRILLQIRPKIEKISTFVPLFLNKKYISPKYDLFCYLWGKYLCQ